MADINSSDNVGEIPNYSIIPPSIQQESESAGIIKELSPRKVLEQVRMNLNGYFFNYDLGKYEQLMKPLMNENGVTKIMWILSSAINDVITFSNYKEGEAEKFTIFVCEKGLFPIHINWREYGIQSKSDLEIIDSMVMNLTFGAFRKALGAGDRNVVRDFKKDVRALFPNQFGNQIEKDGNIFK